MTQEQSPTKKAKVKDGPAANILFIDDDAAATGVLVRALKRRGACFGFHSATNSTEAFALAQGLLPQVAVVDLSLDPSSGPESGLTLIEQLLDVIPEMRIIVLTGHGTEEVGIRALERGAASFLHKPADPGHLLALIKDAVSFTALRSRYLELLHESAQTAMQALGLSTRNALMREVLDTAVFAAANNQPLLITGETGTGKGVIAQAIHQLSHRKSNSFVRFQPFFSGHDLVASDLFGHRKGAFTGATDERRGLIEEAHRGTLFIDEVADLPQETQVMLLHVLQERTFRRIGSTKELSSDFRLITATNRTPDEMLKKEMLRQDFFHRIAHLTLEVPPLRKRSEDIPQLAFHFAAALANRENLRIQGFAANALKKLTRHSWPGNVRELQAAAEGGAYRAHYHHRRFIEADDLKISGKQPARAGTTLSFREQVNAFEQQLVLQTLSETGGNQTRAAELLGLERSSFRRILKRAQVRLS